METALTSEGFRALLANPDLGLLPEDVARALVPWLRQAKTDMSGLLTQIAIPEIYDVAQRQYWWGASELAGFDCSLVKEAVSLIDDYNRLPCGIGSAIHRQRLLYERKGVEVIEKATIALTSVLQ